MLIFAIDDEPHMLELLHKAIAQAEPEAEISDFDAAVIVLMLGLFAWAAVGTLETTADATTIVQDHTARIVAADQGADTIQAGMPIRIASQDFAIASVDYDEYGRATAQAEVSLPDGTYAATIV